MSDLKYSIIIPAYNAEGFLARAVDSIKSQDYDSWEIIIVENGSTDNTYEVSCSMASDKIHVFQSDKGVSNARNLGIGKARGEWLIFLDADDELLPGSLSGIARDISDNSALISYRYEHNATSENIVSYQGNERVQTYLIECLKDPTQRCNSTAVLFNRHFILENEIRFNSFLSHAEDAVFLLSCIVKAEAITDVDRSIYRVIPNDNSAVRSMSEQAINSYCNSIREADKVLGDRANNVDNAFRVFAISQLLVILVNGVYGSTSFGESIKKTKELCSRDLFKDAIEKVDVTGLPTSRRVTMTLLKKQMYTLVGVIIKIRIKQKKSSR